MYTFYLSIAEIQILGSSEQFRLQACRWGHERLLYGAFAFVVCLDFWQSFYGFADAVQEGILVIQFLAYFPDIVRILGKNEIRKCQIAKCEVFIAIEPLAKPQFLLHLGWRTFHILCVVLREEERSIDRSDIGENSQQIINQGLILYVFAQQVLAARSVDDVPIDCHRLGDLQMAFQEVGQVREGEAHCFFVLVEPFIAICVQLVFPGCLRVGQQETGHLAEAADWPVAEHNL